MIKPCPVVWYFLGICAFLVSPLSFAIFPGGTRLTQADPMAAQSLSHSDEHVHQSCPLDSPSFPTILVLSQDTIGIAEQWAQAFAEEIAYRKRDDEAGSVRYGAAIESGQGGIDFTNMARFLFEAEVVVWVGKQGDHDQTFSSLEQFLKRWEEKRAIETVTRLRQKGKEGDVWLADAIAAGIGRPILVEVEAKGDGAPIVFEVQQHLQHLLRRWKKQ